MKFLFGVVVGIIITAAAVFIAMPKLMIVTSPSNFDYDTTVAKLEQSIKDNQWSHKGTIHIHKSLQEAGHDFSAKAGVVKLCKSDYAYEILSNPDERFVTCLMPCGIGIWEDEDGTVYVSKMNTGLMGTMFGGSIKRVMGGNVSADEEKILSTIIK